EKLVREHGFAAEYALSHVTRKYVKAFQSLTSESFISSRVSDIYDIERQVLSHLLGQRREQLKTLTEPVIVLAHDLTPRETAALNPHMVHASATKGGGRPSHTAIMAGALEIPAVVGIGPFLADISGGDPVIVDGNNGVLIIDPDSATLAQYEKERK